jgi:hypothetical protein
LLTPPRSSNLLGVKILPALIETITAPESQARGRHLREGSLPSGNSRIR